jgi:glyoxylase-like metal-dependent hydrolase (beta-lactamase superfamily II)
MKVTDTVYALDSTRGSYVYLILDPAGNCLIDTGLPGRGRAILKELEALGVRPETIRQILLTHYDIDHIGNAAMLQKATGAELWGPAEDIPYILGERARPGIKKAFTALFWVEKPRGIRAYPQDRLMAGLRVIPTPGHTPGHVCLLVEDLLFAGDLVENRGGRLKPLGSWLTWDGAVLRDSLAKTAELSFRWICPAHGAPVERSDRWKPETFWR